MANPRIDVQDEIAYSIAWGMLVAMVRQGTLTNDEFDAIHQKILQRYHPAAVRRLA